LRIRIVGIGTEFGDDAAGPLVVQSLASGPALPVGVEAIPCDRPLELLDLLQGIDAAVLVDATRSGRPPGTVHEPAIDELCEARPVSSHGMGVREALAMARALGRAPDRIAIIGIEAGSATGARPSPRVRSALEEGAARAREKCAVWMAGEAAAAAGRSRRA
jgi:hydrogenase maturation protease